jgi:hypothetical protein
MSGPLRRSIVSRPPLFVHHVSFSSLMTLVQTPAISSRKSTSKRGYLDFEHLLSVIELEQFVHQNDTDPGCSLLSPIRRRHLVINQSINQSIPSPKPIVLQYRGIITKAFRVNRPAYLTKFLRSLFRSCEKLRRVHESILESSSFTTSIDTRCPCNHIYKSINDLAVSTLSPLER